MLSSSPFFRVTQKLKKIITPHNKCFWCDSHPRLCIACIRIRYKIMGVSPYVPYTSQIPVATKKGVYAWKSNRKDKWYPLIRIAPKKWIAKVFGYWEYQISDPCKIMIRSELPLVKVDFVVKAEK